MTYPALKQLVEAGAIQSFENFFLHISPKQFATDMGITDMRPEALRQLPSQMTVGEIVAVSKLLDVDPGLLGAIIHGGSVVGKQ